MPYAIMPHAITTHAEPKPHLSIAIMGHVDSGKSTMNGHLLYQCGGICQRSMQRMEDDATAMGKSSFKYAWFSDRTKSERERGISINAHETQLITRKFTLMMVDLPGHRDFVKATITGAAATDCAVLVVSASIGEFECGMSDSDVGQTKEHALIAFALGIKQLIVVVNKMDTVAYAQNRFDTIKTEMAVYLATLGFTNEDIQYVPISGWCGDNLTSRSKSPQMRWYHGPCLLDALDTLRPVNRASGKPLRMPVQAVYKIGGIGTVVVGRVETGDLQAGMAIQVGPDGDKGVAFSIEVNHTSFPEARPGTWVGINVKGIAPIRLKRGFVISDPNLHPARQAKTFTAQIVILNHPGLITKGFTPIVYCHTMQIACRLKEIKAKLDRQTGQVLESDPESMQAGHAYLVVMEPTKPAVFEAFREFPSLGRIIIRDGMRTTGLGVIRSVEKVVV